MDARSPTPWALEIDDRDECGILAADKTYVCCTVPEDLAEDERGNDFGPSRVNAAYIVRCVNAHEALVAALQDILKAYSDAGSEDPRWDYHKDPSVKLAVDALAAAGVSGCLTIATAE